MQIENAWSALIALVVGIAFTLAFVRPLVAIIGVNSTEAQIFLYVISALIVTKVALWIPWKNLVQDDTGGVA